MNKIDIKIEVNFKLILIILLMFIGMKITGLISWSWVWVLSPLWCGLILFAITVLVVFIKEYIDYIRFMR